MFLSLTRKIGGYKLETISSTLFHPIKCALCLHETEVEKYFMKCGAVVGRYRFPRKGFGKH